MKKVLSIISLSFLLLFLTPHVSITDSLYESANEDEQVNPDNEHEEEPDPYPT
ncbi:hypothetical protein [Ornithinibacillus xuwenensis]|jgi:hypothetical protein|uniref:Secreted protein n=1 Tax=Ornithinibacillus xuwenensis TaxID=3144668 RepID=A0ABU9XFP4_9BACI